MFSRWLSPDGEAALDLVLEGVAEPEVAEMMRRARAEEAGRRTIGNPDRGLSALGPEVMGVDAVDDARLAAQTEEEWNAVAGRGMSGFNGAALL